MEDFYSVYSPSATTAESAGSPDALGAVLGALGSVSSGVAGVAGTLLTIQANRDGLIGAREDRQFANYLRGSEMDLAKKKAAIGSEVELTKAQTMLERARAELSSSGVRWDYVLAALAVVAGGVAIARFAGGRR